MMRTRMELERLLIERLREDPRYAQALAIVRQNTTGRIWLAGGMVSRTLLAELYHTPQERCDFDFVVETIREPLIVPHEWNMRRKAHGNPTFECDDVEIDLFPIATHAFISSNHLEPTIKNFFRSVPFTIQAIAFDVEEQRLVGDVGMKAILAREYRVNNLVEAKRMTDAKGITINERIERKAKSLGVTPILQ
jgi:hypothetical protein